MIRLSLAVALAALLQSGCGQLGDVFAQDAAAENNEQNPIVAERLGQQGPEQGNEDIKTPLIRALIQTVDEVKGESPEVKDSLKKALREADADLSKVLGGKSKLLIMQANRKPPAPIIGDRVRVEAKIVKPKPAAPVEPPKNEVEVPFVEELPGIEPEQPAEPVPAEAAPATPPPARPPIDEPTAVEDEKPQSPMLDALLETIDKDAAQDPAVKQRLRELLRQADKEMDGALSAKKVPVRAPVAPRAKGPTVRTYSRGGMSVREFHAPAPAAPAPK